LESDEKVLETVMRGREDKEEVEDGL